MNIESDFVVGIFASIPLQRQLAAATQHSTITGNIIDSWSLILSERPRLAIFEIGKHTSTRDFAAIKRVLKDCRARLKTDIATAVILTSPEQSALVGELLFDENTSASSQLLDAILIQPPSTLLTAPTIQEQLKNLIAAYSHEFIKRAQGAKPTPPLGAEHWIASMADPNSRALWLQWLPRYASYINESVLIVGPTGAGKTKLAEAVHALSLRKGPFVSMTPRDFSSSELMQAELFGAVPGAYTGAVDKWGLVKAAEGGTLFIDELQSIDKDLQGKLITFIENKSYRRVGSAEVIKADVRFVFATNQPVKALVHSDVLRDDFAYRLERVLLELPPLAARPLDVGAALSHSLAKIRRQRANMRAIHGFSQGAYRLLFTYEWPGNLRQLENIVAKACEQADLENREIIDEQIVCRLLESVPNSTITDQTLSELISYSLRSAAANNPTSLDLAFQQTSDAVYRHALTMANGDTAQAAAFLKLPEQIIKIIKARYGLD